MYGPFRKEKHRKQNVKSRENRVEGEGIRKFVGNYVYLDGGKWNF